MSYDPGGGLINGANLMTGLIRQGQQTQDYIGGMFDDAAKRRAGAAAAAGDYSTASTVLGGRGMLADSDAMRARGTTTAVLKAADAGDMDAATAAAAAGGDTALYGTVHEQETKDRADRANWLANGADALAQINGPDGKEDLPRRQQAFHQYIAPTLKAMHMKDEDIARIEAGNLTNQALQAFKTTLGRAHKGEIKQDADGNWVNIDSSAGTVTTISKGAKKAEWKEVKRGDGSTYWVDLNADGGPKEGAGPGSDTPEPSGAVYDTIATVATKAGAKPEEVRYLKRSAEIESSGGKHLKNGKSTGVFQFHPDTFAAVGGGDINSIEDQTKAALALSRRDRAVLQSEGVETTDANLYIMHQQGAGGGLTLLMAPPDMGAVAALTPAYKGDAATAKKAIVGNGGKTDMTAGEFVNYWRDRWSGGTKETAGRKGVVEGSAAPTDDGSLSTDAVEQAAERYLTNGTLPPFGMGKTGTANRDKVLNKAAEMEKASGRTGAEAVTAWAGVKADAASLADLTKRRGNIKAFEDTAVANADLALSLAPKGAARLNVPVLDRWVQSGRKAVLGDPAVTQFDVALGTFLDEYAKIVSGATGGTGSTDASRREAYDRLSKFATQGQLRAGISTMKTEMGNRTIALDQEIAATKARISGKPAPAAPHAAAIAPLKGSTPAQEQARAKFQNSGAKAGEPTNPFVPTTAAQFNGLANGAWFINPKDGQVLQKKR